MVKKISVLLFIFTFIIVAGKVIVKADNLNNVKDYLNYLTADEVINLQSAIDSVREDYNLDVVIVITDHTEGKSSMEFADDYYDDNGYGVGDDYSGLLMLINMDQREVWISTTGRAIDIFTDGRISNMVNNITSSLTNGRYYDASNTFINNIKEYAKVGVPSNQIRVPDKNPGVIYPVKPVKLTYLNKVMGLIKSFPVYIVAFFISIITTILASLSSKGKVTISNQTYEGKFSLLESRDDYIRQTVIETKIERDTSSDSISSTHTGSSGTNHGGGGGKF